MIPQGQAGQTHLTTHHDNDNDDDDVMMIIHDHDHILLSLFGLFCAINIPAEYWYQVDNLLGCLTKPVSKVMPFFI